VRRRRCYPKPLAGAAPGATRGVRLPDVGDVERPPSSGPPSTCTPVHCQDDRLSLWVNSFGWSEISRTIRSTFVLSTIRIPSRHGPPRAPPQKEARNKRQAKGGCGRLEHLDGGVRLPSWLGVFRNAKAQFPLADKHLEVLIRRVSGLPIHQFCQSRVDEPSFARGPGRHRSHLRMPPFFLFGALMPIACKRDAQSSSLRARQDHPP